ncbi:hypothetical protein MLD38_016314 [Melastoma candidum]|uniref:Uncharacterized protein n=1 Tax=Melastoma candidum TaxID=119954 RepID=A0ACB9RJ63_9MYRT|nr:hypothetical protein MLD38_016314 [Melastoma candidum]
MAPLTWVMLLQVFVANPNKPPEIKAILAKNHEKLLSLLHDLPASKGKSYVILAFILEHLRFLRENVSVMVKALSSGGDDEQFEEERELVIKEIERISRLVNLER